MFIFQGSYFNVCFLAWPIISLALISGVVHAKIFLIIKFVEQSVIISSHRDINQKLLEPWLELLRYLEVTWLKKIS